VDYAILETSGKLSVFKKNQNKYGNLPLPIILDGEIQKETLKEIKKTKGWLLDTLKELDVKLEDIFYAFYKGKDVFLIRKQDLKK